MMRAQVAGCVAIALLVGACRHDEAATTYITSGTLDASSAVRAAIAERERADALRAAQEANAHADSEHAALHAEVAALREREEFARTAWTQLGHLNERIRALDARAPRLSSSRRARLETQLATLRRMQDELDRAIHELPDLSGAEWDAERRRIQMQLEEADGVAVEAAWSSEP